ncbi:MAG: M50 family metallopeptidase [Deltaproteobacteria bacterium]|nr:M50 family metallopeptidase [Deltaproteobacteria bacterium]
MRTHLLLALLASAILGLLCWHMWALFPFKLLVVLMHESGHAAATLLMGGSVDTISVSPDEAGATWSRYAPTFLNTVVIKSAGYVGSTVSGCVLLQAAARSKEGKWPLIALAVWTGLVSVLWVRDPFTLAFSLGCTVMMGLLARFGPTLLRRMLLAFLASFSVLYALIDIKDDLLHLGGSGGSDADALAQATFIPAIVWGLGWGALSLVLVFFTLRNIFRMPAAQPQARPGASDGLPTSAAVPQADAERVP